MELEQSVKFIRMSTGEDLVSEVVEVKEDKEHNYYVLVNPLKILYMSGTTNPNVVSITLMQWVFHKVCDRQEFTIYPNDVITMADANESLIEYYHDSIEHFEKLKEKNRAKVEEKEAEKEASLEEIMESLNDYFKVASKRTLH